MQAFIRCRQSDIKPTVSALQQTISEVDTWCSSRRLQLNAQKTELVWFGTSTNLRKLSTVDKQLQIGTVTIKPSEVVRDLGIIFDSELSMRNHVSRLTRSCFYQLRRLRSIRRQLDVTSRSVLFQPLCCLASITVTRCWLNYRRQHSRRCSACRTLQPDSFYISNGKIISRLPTLNSTGYRSGNELRINNVF